MSKNRTKKRKPLKTFNIKNFIAILICIIIGVSGGGVLIAYNALDSLNYQPLEDTTKTTDSEGNTIENPYTTSAEDANMSLTNGKLLDDPQVLNIMLFGEDKAQGNEEHGRSDTMIMLSIDNINKSLKLTTFMRDLYVNIPGYGFNKLNAAYSWGGASLSIQTVESNFGINIDRYAIVDFQSFQKIIDVLGGIDIELSQDEIDYINWQMYRNNQTDTETDLVAEPGIVHLNGTQALWYARNRGDEDAGFSGDDFDRTQRQRKLLGVLVDDMKDASLTQIIEIVGEIGPMITTNLKKDEITFLVANSLTYLNYELLDFNVPTDGAWQYGWTDDRQSIIEVTDWNKQIFEVAYFVYEDKLLEANPEYAQYVTEETKSTTEE